jgi:hypothetical protein
MEFAPGGFFIDAKIRFIPYRTGAFQKAVKNNIT